MSLMLNKVKKQSEGVNFANKAYQAATSQGETAKVVDNASKFTKSTPVSLHGEFGVFPVKKKLNVEIKRG